MLSGHLSRMQSAVVADFTGLTMQAMEPLRRDARAQDCEYLVVKKTLLKRAATAQGIAVDDALCEGGVSMLFGFSDAVAPARIAKAFVKQHEAMQVRGGFLREGDHVRTVSVADVVMLGNLPSRDELIAKAVGSIAAPLRGLVGVLQGNLRNLVGVLQAITAAKA